jgi:DNA-binding MarR family transcriptional regulator
VENFVESSGGPVRRLRFTILGLQRSGQRALSESLRPAGITPAQAEILSIVAEREPMTLRDLGQLLVCEAGSPSRAVDLLVSRGLVERALHHDDRRAVLLRLTPEGRLLLPAIRSAEHAIETRFGDALNPAEQDALLRLLDRAY